MARDDCNRERLGKLAISNASALTINDLSANGSIALPTADVLDTGTAAVTLNAAIGNADHRRVFLQVKNTDGSNNLTVAVKAGATNPPAFRGALGDLSVTIAAGATKVIGPFDPSRFAKADGTLDVKFTPAAGTIGVNATLFRLAKHV